MSKQSRLTFGGKSKKSDDKEKFLDRVQEMVDLVNSTNSSNDKIDNLKKFPDLKDFIKVVYDPLKPFHIRPDSVKKFAKLDKSVKPVQYPSVLELLNALVDAEITGHEAAASILKLIQDYPYHEDLIYLIIDKDLKIRMGTKQINKAFKKLIPIFDVALGYDYNKYPKAFDSGDWKISRKLDGVRCITIVDSLGDEIKFFSRTGNEFQTLDKVGEQIRKVICPLFPKGVVLDGEICIIGNDDKENFKGVMKEVRKKGHVMKKPRYLLFDCLEPSEFWNRSSTRIFSERIRDLEKIRSKVLNIPEIGVIDQIDFTEDRFVEYLDLSKKLEWEGLIVRKDCEYEGKRTKNVLKVKQFETEEYKVMDVSFGPFQALNKDTGLTETIETLVSVTILHKNFPVSVGSGFSLAERKRFYKDPNKIKGKVISVQYFEETTDKDGNLSLRFPTFKGIYGVKRMI